MIKKATYKLGILLILSLLGFNSLATNLSDRAEISIITCAPGNQAYSVYGHSAIRVQDPVGHIDMAYNYGIFDFDSPNFLYRFASGQTDYLLGAYRFNSFLQEYKYKKHSVYEQVLNLSPTEKQKIFDFLQWNAKPENRIYRYNFFFDNCATKVRDVVQNNIGTELIFADAASGKTFRTLVKDYHSRIKWLNFGIDFLISRDADRTATFLEEMFLPFYLKKHFATAKRADNNQPIVLKTNVILEYPPKDKTTNWLVGPFAVFLLLFLFVLLITVKQFRKGKLKACLDYILYGINGLCGSLIMWFTLYSEHPAMRPNFNLMWLIPLSFPFAIAWTVKKWRPGLKYYHLIFSVWLIIFVIINFFLPQKFHPAFYVMIAIFLCRSVAHSLMLKKES